MLVRAAKDAFTPCDKEKVYMFRREEDGTRAFIPEAPIYVINEASVDDLKAKIMAKYQGTDADKVEITAESFRPNIVIRTDKAYEEDEFGECRVHNIFFRYLNHTKHDNKCCANSKEGKYNHNMEPLTTLKQVRKNPWWGYLFGSNFAPEVVTKEDDFKKLLPKENTVPKDRFYSKHGFLVKGDKFHVRRKTDLPRIESE